MDLSGAEEWVKAYVRPAGPIDFRHQRPWSRVARVPLDGGDAWFKACGGLQAFEPRLTAQLFNRWPDRVPELLAADETRGWLLMADAGTRIGDLQDSLKAWLRILPMYAELQLGETAYAPEHLLNGVPDERVDCLPDLYDDLLQEDLPVASDDRRKLSTFAPRFEQLCGELSSLEIPETIQHDDLHMNNVYARGEDVRVLDWGDSSVSHPFASLVATFRFLEERNGISEGDPWHSRIRDAYLEPWGQGLSDAFELAIRVGTFAHAIAAMRQRRALSGTARDYFDLDLSVRLERAVRRVKR